MKTPARLWQGPATDTWQPSGQSSGHYSGLRFGQEAKPRPHAHNPGETTNLESAAPDHDEPLAHRPSRSQRVRPPKTKRRKPPYYRLPLHRGRH
ncbi:MAG: hypothetical protein KC474_05925 [Cyanobacteria bacterium HKST-UBA04]|nr:hypothetical protein [Cyanobacteria bacterium HKST-UBA04]MCA9841438.1 hypothetical protein [Cyanobacteria bacterium HKST-UBA03]